jgi:hypothetical protein
MNKIIYNIFFTILFKSFRLFGQRSNLINDKDFYFKRLDFIRNQTTQTMKLNLKKKDLSLLQFNVISELIIHTIFEIKRNIKYRNKELINLNK